MVREGISDSLLGRHVRWRADSRARLRQRAGGGDALRHADRFGDTEIRHHRSATGQHDVVRFHIPVHDTLRMRIRERSRDIAEDTDALRDCRRGWCDEACAQGRPFLKRHDEVQHPIRISRVEQGHDVRMAEARGDADFPEKPLAA